MDTGSELTTHIDRLLPERLQRLRRVTGLPVAFGGITRPVAAGSQLALTSLAGTNGTALRGLTVTPDRGLGGRVLSRAAPQRVENYATTLTITHDYDRIVVDEERLTSVIAVPLLVRGIVHGVLYAAVRGAEAIGDRAIQLSGLIASQLVHDADHSERPPADESPNPITAALDDLARVVAETTDSALRARLLDIYRAMAPATVTVPARTTVLAPREVDTLRLAAVGATNFEIAARLGLSPETVKAYLRTAMRKLGARNRTAAVHAARLAGII